MAFTESFLPQKTQCNASNGRYNPVAPRVSTDHNLGVSSKNACAVRCVVVEQFLSDFDFAGCCADYICIVNGLRQVKVDFNIGMSRTRSI